MEREIKDYVFGCGLKVKFGTHFDEKEKVLFLVFSERISEGNYVLFLKMSAVLTTDIT